MMLSDNTVVFQKIASYLSYVIGSGLFVGDVMNYLNENAAGIGVMIGTATFLINWIYHHKRYKRYKQNKSAE